jgi:hypothetical protein
MTSKNDELHSDCCGRDFAGPRTRHADATDRALSEIAAERLRQIVAEGWTPEHNDQHRGGEMALAAACYAISGAGRVGFNNGLLWPFSLRWWKPSDCRHDLIRSAALLVAELERLDRAAPRGPATMAHLQTAYPQDAEERASALEAAVAGHSAPPTVAAIASDLGWPVLAVAEAVGAHYWMFLTGDLSSPETARIEAEGD